MVMTILVINFLDVGLITISLIILQLVNENKNVFYRIIKNVRIERFSEFD